jgi:hypothetical protein
MKKLAEYFTESEQGSIRPQVGDTFEIHVNEELAIEAGVLESTEDKLVLEYDERGIALLDSLGLTEGFTPDSFNGYVENFEFTGDDGETQMGTLYFTANVEDGQVVVDPKSLRGESEPNYIAKVDNDMATMNVQQGGVDYEAAIEDAQEEAEVIWSMRDDKYAHGESVEHIDEEELDEMHCGSKRKKYEDVELEENPIKKALGKLIKPHTTPTPTQDEKNDNPLKKFKDIFDRASTMPGVKKEEVELDEAEYQGRKVKLGKPMRGDVAKYKVYVKDPKTGNVKKVNFGDKNMEIKRDDPKRRKSFRARHGCGTPKASDRTKARYWSCRMWSKKPVSKIV